MPRQGLEPGRHRSLRRQTHTKTAAGSTARRRNAHPPPQRPSHRHHLRPRASQGPPQRCALRCPRRAAGCGRSSVRAGLAPVDRSSRSTSTPGARRNTRPSSPAKDTPAALSNSRAAWDDRLEATRSRSGFVAVTIRRASLSDSEVTQCTRNSAASVSGSFTLSPSSVDEVISGGYLAQQHRFWPRSSKSALERFVRRKPLYRVHECVPRERSRGPAALTGLKPDTL